MDKAKIKSLAVRLCNADAFSVNNVDYKNKILKHINEDWPDILIFLPNAAPPTEGMCRHEQGKTIDVVRRALWRMYYQ